MVQFHTPGSLPQYMEILGDTIQDEIWMGTQIQTISLPLGHVVVVARGWCGGGGQCIWQHILITIEYFVP